MYPIRNMSDGVLETSHSNRDGKTQTKTDRVTNLKFAPPVDLGYFSSCLEFRMHLRRATSVKSSRWFVELYHLFITHCLYKTNLRIVVRLGLIPIATKHSDQLLFTYVGNA